MADDDLRDFLDRAKPDGQVRRSGVPRDLLHRWTGRLGAARNGRSG